MYCAVQGPRPRIAHNAADARGCIVTAVEHQRFRSHGSRKLADRFGARCRNADGEIRVRRVLRRRGKSVGQSVNLKRNRMSEPGSQPRGESGSAGDAHLLAENRADSEFETIPGARDAQAGPRLDQAGQQRIAFEAGIDRQRIGIQIEHAPDASHHVQQPRGPDEIHAKRQRVPGACGCTSSQPGCPSSTKVLR